MAEDSSSKHAHNFKDLTGHRFDRLIVIALKGVYKSPSGTKRAAWICQCDCSKITVVRTVNLTSGGVKSCGCLRSETSQKIHFKHGLTNSPEYTIWQNMIRRCYDRKNSSFQYYGHRGIKVCDRWHTFTITFNDQTKTLVEWSHSTGIYYKVLQARLDRYKWSVERAFTEKSGKYRKNNIWVVYNGQRKTLSEWAKETGIRRGLIYHRLKIYKWAVERTLTQSVRKVKPSGKLLRKTQGSEHLSIHEAI